MSQVLVQFIITLDSAWSHEQFRLQWKPMYGLGETNEAGEQLEDFCLEHELAVANTMFKQHWWRLYIWTCPDGDTQNQIDYISIAQRWKTSRTNCRTYPRADCDTDHQLLVATLKLRLAKRQRQHSIPPLNLEELKEEKAVQFAADMTNRFTALKTAQVEVTPEDLWKGGHGVANSRMEDG